MLSSRLIPDLDGGYTIATIARARQLAARGADVEVLTFDPADAAAHAAHRAEFARRGMLPDGIPLRNLFDEAQADGGGAAEWLPARAGAGAAAAAERRVLSDAAGRPFLALPVIPGNPDWHLTEAAVAVFDAAGAEVGALRGFRELYRVWLERVVSEDERPVVVICESRQLGELIADWSEPRVRIVHTVHTMHLEPPYTPDAPVNPLWSRWFALQERFDAVLWPTEAQRDDVVRRFGAGAGAGADAGAVNLVAPHGIALPDGVDDAAREAGLVVSVSRLAPGKRIDHIVRAFLAADVPGSRLEIWGDGPSRAGLAELIDELDAGDRVVLCGQTDDPSAVLRRASVMVTATAFEGQGLSIVEAMAQGCPVISYDVRYGPGDALRGGGGLLVPSGDEGALGDGIRSVLTDPALRARLAAEAPAAASRWSEDAAMEALAAASRLVLSAPSRRPLR